MTEQPIEFYRLITDAHSEATRKLGNVTGLSATLTPNEAGDFADLALAWTADVTDEVSGISFLVRDQHGNSWPFAGSSVSLDVELPSSGSASVGGAITGDEAFTVYVSLDLVSGGKTAAMSIAIT